MEKTVAKALLILESIARSNRPRGVTELAAELHMTKANVHRLVRTLTELEYLRQRDDSGRYELSMKLWSLGARMIDQSDLMSIAGPIVRELRDQTGESVQLAVRDGDAVVYVDKADSVRPVRATTTIGSRVPIHCVSTGKAILASCSDALANLVFPLKRTTPSSVSSRAELVKQLDAVRACGYAVNKGEWREGIWGLAAAILDGRGEVKGAVGIWGPQERFESQSVSKLSRSVVAAASRISSGLGRLETPNAKGAAKLRRKAIA